MGASIAVGDPKYDSESLMQNSVSNENEAIRIAGL